MDNTFDLNSGFTVRDLGVGTCQSRWKFGAFSTEAALTIIPAEMFITMCLFLYGVISTVSTDSKKLTWT